MGLQQDRGRGRRALVGGLGLVVALGLLTGVWWVLVGAPRADQRAAAATAEAFLAGWSAQDWPAVAARVGPAPTDVVDAHRMMIDALEVTEMRYTPSRIDVDGREATVAFTGDLVLSGMGPLSYTSSLRLVREEEWQVAWEPSVLHPALTEGGRFERSRSWPERGRVLAIDATPLSTPATAVEIGVQPDRITDAEAVIRALVDVAGADEPAVRELLTRPDLDRGEFHPVVELPRPAFDAVDPALRPVPGILFRATGADPGTSAAVAAIVGRTGVLDAEQAEERGSSYQEGDVAGVSGVQLAREEQLAGAPAIRAAVVDDGGDVVEELLAVDAVPGEDVRATLDPRLQRIAEEVLAGGPAPAALVAIDIPSGGLRAIANAPMGGFDRALQGRYPPGSTFKVVTSAALLGAGVGPDGTLGCPAQEVVGGRAFRNAGGFDLGAITHRTALARSCNTAYVGATDLLDEGVLTAAARAFGFVDPVDALPVPTFAPSFPDPADVTELAAASIGQARVEASPAHMASVAAAAASGVWRSPRLLVDDEQEERPIPGDHLALADMMRAVVTEGTGETAALPDIPIAGKTGSAEFGTDDPPQTHAWFIGFHDDLAVAVLVEGGGAGGAVAAPLAARFLDLGR
jgi:hypothetical protein